MGKVGLIQGAHQQLRERDITIDTEKIGFLVPRVLPIDQIMDRYPSKGFNRLYLRLAYPAHTKLIAN